MASTLIIRHVEVNYALTLQEAFEATGRVIHFHDGVKGDVMFQGGNREVEAVFFKPSFTDNEDPELEFVRCGLVPLDPIALAKINTDDLSFGVQYPNVTYWQDASGQWYYVTIDRWENDDRVVIGRQQGLCFRLGWFNAGRCK